METTEAKGGEGLEYIYTGGRAACGSINERRTRGEKQQLHASKTARTTKDDERIRLSTPAAALFD